MNQIQKSKFSNRTKLLLMIAIISGSSLASAPHPKNGQPFTLDTEEAAHHFTPMGTLIPAAGHAQLSYFFIITEIEESATRLMNCMKSC